MHGTTQDACSDEGASLRERWHESGHSGAYVNRRDEQRGDERNHDARHERLRRDFEKAIASGGEPSGEDERPNNAPDASINPGEGRGDGGDGLHNQQLRDAGGQYYIKDE